MVFEYLYFEQPGLIGAHPKNFTKNAEFVVPGADMAHAHSTFTALVQIKSSL